MEGGRRQEGAAAPRSGIAWAALTSLGTTDKKLWIHEWMDCWGSAVGVNEAGFLAAEKDNWELPGRLKTTGQLSAVERQAASGKQSVVEISEGEVEG